ncbi:MAG: hypothetical protein SF053_01505 [Bacteroidia bacterium]|nr:hypothetical protein [Bacteroidia bacterium]
MNRTVILGALIAVIAIGGIAGYLLWNKPHTDAAVTRPDIVLAAEALVSAYEENEKQADSLYLGKLVELSGSLASVTDNGAAGMVVSLDATATGAVSCAFLPEASDKLLGLAPGTPITVRGFCDGLNMFDVNLSRCVRVQ